jgi:hypothetical protein
MPEFMRKLRDYANDGPTYQTRSPRQIPPHKDLAPLALDFTALNALRPGQAAKMRWSDIKQESGIAVCRIVAEDMKNGITHDAPLSSASLAVLERVRERTRGEGDMLIFLGGEEPTYMADRSVLQRRKESKKLETGRRRRIRQTNRSISRRSKCMRHSRRSNPMRVQPGWMADYPVVRGRLAGKSLQAMESNELRKLLSAAGTGRLHSQKDWRAADFRCADTPGIMHLMQFALGMMDEDGQNWQPILPDADQQQYRS